MKKNPNALFYFLLIVFFSIFYSCSSFKIENVTYGWSSEVFVNPDDSGNISVQKSSMNFNITSLLTVEKVTEKLSTLKIRIIRDDEGYYFLTADKFKYVWVFESAEKSLKLKNKLELAKDIQLNDPKFNEHKPNVELFTKDGKIFVIDKEGIVKNEEKKNEK